MAFHRDLIDGHVPVVKMEFVKCILVICFNQVFFCLNYKACFDQILVGLIPIFFFRNYNTIVTLLLPDGMR